MSVNTYALTTVARLKTFLGITSSDYDTVLEYIINSVTDFVENECDRRFKKTAYTDEKLNGRGTTKIVLPQWPVVSGQTITLYDRQSGSDYGSDDSADWDTIDSDDYRVDYDSGIIDASFRFYKGFENYKIDYTAGYDFDVNGGTYLSSVGLSDLEWAVWQLCAAAFNKRKGEGDIQSMRLYNYDVTFSTKNQEDKEVKAILDKYKRFTF